MFSFRKLLIFTLPLFLVACNPKTTVANNLHERDANEMVVLLVSKGIAAEKIAAPASTTGGGAGEVMWNIQVPARQITDALSVLNSAGLPRVKGTNLLDLFGAQGLVPSELQNRIRYQEGLSEQLANTIRKMDGIIDANVQITMPKDDEEEAVQMTASVYVKHRGILDNPNSLMITKIKRLVSSAVPGLAIDNVSVVADRALFADISLDQIQEYEELEYVSVWGVILAKGSVGLFRTILYIFIVLIFLLCCTVLWMFWKTFHIIARNGAKAFFHPLPYRYEVVSENPEGEEMPEEPAPPEGGGM